MTMLLKTVLIRSIVHTREVPSTKLPAVLLTISLEATTKRVEKAQQVGW